MQDIELLNFIDGTAMTTVDAPFEAVELLEERAKSLAVSASLAAAGGYLDAFTYLGHGRVFANAMTGNVVLLGVDAISGSWRASLRHILPISMFLLGVAAARMVRVPGVRRWLLYPEPVVLAVEILVLFALAWLPSNAPDILITMTIAFAASLQMATFREVGGKTYSSTFTTGNLRTMIESGFDWLVIGRLPAQLVATRQFATICAMFLAGAAAGAFTTPRLRNHALWIDVAALSLVLLWLLRGARRPVAGQP
jgi:uncharacterized membrane protein YoaK (UPF0700 family)